MFEIGDKIVCITLGKIYCGDGVYDGHSLDLELYKTYTFRCYGGSSRGIRIEEHPHRIYDKMRFNSLINVREEKILKLKERLCLKSVTK